MGGKGPEIVGTDSGKALQYDPSFQGPIANRSCRDVIWLLFFIAFWVGMGYLANIGFTDGKPKYAYIPIDSEDRFCGVNTLEDETVDVDRQANMEPLPNLWFPNAGEGSVELTEDLQNFTVLCDYDYLTRDILTPGDAETWRDQPTMAAGECSGLTKPVWSDYCKAHCWLSYFEWYELALINRCFPSALNSTAMEAVDGYLGAVYNAELLTEVIDKPWILGAAALGALIVGFVWLFVLRLFAGLFVWITILSVLVILAGGAYYLYDTSNKDQADCDEKEANQEELQCSSSKEKNIEYMLYGSYGAAGLAAIYFFMILGMRNRVNLAIDVVKEASKAIVAMPLLVVFPVFTVIAILTIIGYWVMAGLYLVTSAPFSSTGGHRSFTIDRTMQGYLAYHLFGGLWGVYLMIAISQCTIAGAVAGWYWKRNKKDLPSSPILRSFGRVMRYHLGSLCFGSFLIALLTWLRIMLNYIRSKFKKGETKMIKYAMVIINCLLRCFEKFVKYINKNAYIEIAVYGESFCTAAKRAVQLLFRNILRVAAINVIGDFLLFIGRVFIAIATGAAVAFGMIYQDLEFWQVPAALSVIIGFAVGTMFMNVYEMAIDTILLCFCEDVERNDGSPSRPYYMSDSLRQYITKAEQRAH